MTKCITILFCLLLVPLNMGYVLAQQRTIDEAVPSLVYIKAVTINQKTGGGDPHFGTGFIVSKDGHLLTAYHVVKGWDAQPLSDREKHPIEGSLEDNLHLNLTLQLVDKDENADVALLRVKGDRRDYTPVNVCLDHVRNLPANGEPIIAFGFPLANDRQPVSGTLGNMNASFDRWTGWAANVTFEDGMSGGPVYGSRGTVIGVVKGSQNNPEGYASAAVRWITPIQHASTLLDKAAYEERCGPPQEECKRSYNIPESAVRVVAKDSETDSPIACAHVEVSDGKTPERIRQRGSTDRNGYFRIYGSSEDVRLKIAHDDYFSPDAGQEYHPGPEPSVIEVPLGSKRIERCRVPAPNKAFIVTHFMLHGEELAQNVSFALDSDFNIELQKYRLPASSQVSFYVCSEAKLSNGRCGKKVSQVLGAQALMFGDIEREEGRRTYRIATNFIDAYDLFPRPISISYKADLHHVTNPQIRLAVLTSLAAGLKSEGRCADVITVVSIMEAIKLLQDKGEYLQSVALRLRKACQQQLPQNLLLKLIR